MKSLLTRTNLEEGEYPAYFVPHLRTIPADQSFVRAMEQSLDQLTRWVNQQDDGGLGDYRYAPGKWTVAQVVQHLCDSEHIFTYRALRIARGDETPMEGFDQDAYAVAAGHDLSLQQVIAQLAILRQASLDLFASFPSAALQRRGTASGNAVSARALAWITAGHTYHHARVLKERYTR